ncbi:DUF6227 family protein [Actinacidiphila acididurans]|uniref:Uncharacterized protein n=1 Tax=Actinacidiphila acididurans TaxID=2784346 RepID=A0ABS2TYK8_9ACTN|nr:DUF6227 family protein [Actinacidiphila acididurans]MBM9507581.1 hypothetical protein [Actinacidiphila acididurans]
MEAEPGRAGPVVRTGGCPADQLAALLARADSREQAERHLAGAESALMHYCGLQSCRHTNGPPRRMDRRTFRHSFLLPDGDVRVVWELEYDTGADGVTRRSLVTERETLALAEWDADLPFGGPVGVPELAADDPYGLGTALSVPDEPAVPDPGRRRRRPYPEGESAEHARRLLRRAANPNAPGPGIAARLHAAIAHDIAIVARRSALIAGRLVCWSLYEHAFLLMDGTELSLWEIDHTRTPSGAPVCEVYVSQDAALDTAIRRIEAG